MMPQMPLEVSPSVLTVPSVTKLTPAVKTESSSPNCLAWVAKLMASRPASATQSPSAPLAFLAGGKPGLDHGRVLRVRVIDAEHPRDTRVAGELVALVDRRYIQGVPAIEHRRHCQAFA